MSVSEQPQVGQVVDHNFLWLEQKESGREEGRKVRPCINIAVEPAYERDASPRVTVLPITSQLPRRRTTALEVPAVLLPRIGLRSGPRAWVVIDEANVFRWPGYDLVPQSSGGFIKGIVTVGFFNQIRSAVTALRQHDKPHFVERDC